MGVKTFRVLKALSCPLALRWISFTFRA